MTVSRYPKGIETRNMIVAQAKKLFYENGYNATTVTEICKSINIKGGTFTYYFEKKKDLNDELYTRLFSDSSDYVYRNTQRNLPEIQHYIITSFVYYLALFRNQQTINYHREVLINQSIADYIAKPIRPIFENINKAMELKIEPKEINNCIAADSGARRELTLKFIEEYNHSTIPIQAMIDFAAFINTNMGRIFTMDAEIIRSAITIAREFTKEHDCSEIRLLI